MLRNSAFADIIFNTLEEHWQSIYYLCIKLLMKVDEQDKKVDEQGTQ